MKNILVTGGLGLLGKPLVSLLRKKKYNIFVLETIKPNLINGAIILFDELYNFEGWDVGEYKALTEVFDEKDYKFISFSTDTAQAAIKIIN